MSTLEPIVFKSQSVLYVVLLRFYSRLWTREMREMRARERHKIEGEFSLPHECQFQHMSCALNLWPTEKKDNLNNSSFVLLFLHDYYLRPGACNKNHNPDKARESTAV